MHILESSAGQAKAANVDVSEDDLTGIVAGAVQWARDHCACCLGYSVHGKTGQPEQISRARTK